MGRPTLVSLAHDLGVSRQTVSNVINAPHLVKTTTRQRVEERIRETGYRPSAAAQALRSQRSLTVAMRLYPTNDGINGALMDRFLHHVVEVTQAIGYRVVLVTAADPASEVRILTELFETKSIDAALLTDTFVDDPRPRLLAHAVLPFACFGRPWGDDDAAHAWVDIDGRRGTEMATRQLAADGRSEIGFLGWPSPSGVGDDRFRGWSDVMAGRLSAQRLHELDVRVLDGMAEGASGMRDLLEVGAHAVVCASDSLAVGALETLRSRGINAAELPVIGFDDTPVAQAIGLSSVQQPVEDAAEVLVRTLISSLSDASHTEHPPVQRLFPPELRMRQRLSS